MHHGSRVATLAALLALGSMSIAAKERVFSPVAGAGQEIRFSNGQAVLATGNNLGNLAVTFVPLDKKSGFLRIWVENSCEQQFNISEASVSANSAGEPLTVYTYADQVKAQKRKEIWAAIATGIAAGANSYSASQAGYSNYSGGYASRTTSGAYSATTYGRYYGTSYNAGVAYLAQANAVQQNQAMFDRFEHMAASASRSMEQRSLKANTLVPGQSVYGDVKIRLPKAGGALDVVIDVGGQPIALNFREGPPVVDTAPRAVAAVVASPDPGQAPVQQLVMSTTNSMPTVRLSPAVPIPTPRLAAGPGLQQALLHPSGPAARMELQRLGCPDDFNLVSSVVGKSVFEATCGSGKRQLFECRGAGCRPLN